MNPVAEPRERARSLLSSLLNLEWPTRGAALLQPFASKVRPQLAQAALQLAATVGGAAAAPGSIRRVGQFAATLAQIYQQLPAIAAEHATQQVLIPAASLDLRCAAEPRFRRLSAAAHALRAATGTEVLLHGSLASDDWTGYRDADLLLLVPTQRLRSAPALQQLRRQLLPLLRALYEFDPLQHHGVFALPTEELAAWPEHWLPMATLQRAVDIAGNGLALTIAPCHDRKAARAEFDFLVDYFAREHQPRDAYAWKAFLSVLMLIPAVFLGAIGEPCWKGDSFARVRNLVPTALWQAQERASHMRAQWRDPTPGWLRWLLRLAPNPRLLPLLWRRFATPPYPTTVATELADNTRALLSHLAQLLPAEESAPCKILPSPSLSTTSCR